MSGRRAGWRSRAAHYAAYDWAAHYAEQQKAFDDPNIPFYGWHYPPFFLIIAAGLALLPYTAAWPLWMAATLPLYLATMRGVLPIKGAMLAALAGSCLGFLYFNWQPAQIYMGDAGALFLGLMLGALATDVSYTEHSDLGALAPLLILGVPLFDTVFVMGVRWRKGRPMMAGSPDHFALRLRRWRMSTRQTVVMSCVATGGLGVAGLVMTQLGTAGALGVLGLTALLALIAARRLIQIDMGP